MTGYETASGYNVRGTNGSAYEFMGSNPFLQSGYTPGQSPWQGVSPPPSQPQIPYSSPNPFLQTQNPYAQAQSPYAQWQQPYQPYTQQPSFIGPQPFGVPPLGMPGIQQGLPNLGLAPQQQAWRTPGMGFQQGLQQGVTPAVTTKSIDLNLTIPVHRIAGHHPQEIYHYLTQVVLPVLVEGLTRRALTGEPGQSVTLHLNGECVARITL